MRRPPREWPEVAPRALPIRDKRSSRRTANIGEVFGAASAIVKGMSVTMKEITLVPATMYNRVGPSRDIDVAASILGVRPDLPDAVITHRFPLDAGAEAFAVAADRSAGAIKVVLEP